MFLIKSHFKNWRVVLGSKRSIFGHIWEVRSAYNQVPSLLWYSVRPRIHVSLLKTTNRLKVKKFEHSKFCNSLIIAQKQYISFQTCKCTLLVLKFGKFWKRFKYHLAVQLYLSLVEYIRKRKKKRKITSS